MRKKQIIVLGIVMGAALLGLIFTQARYFQTAFKLKRTQFDYLVGKSIDEAVASIERKHKPDTEEDLLQEAVLQEGASEGLCRMPMGIMAGGTLRHTNIGLDIAKSPLAYEKIVPLGSSGKQENRGLLNSIEKSRRALQKQLGKEYDLVVVTKGEESKREALCGQLEQEDWLTLLGKHLKNNGVETTFEYAVKAEGEFIALSPQFFNRTSSYSYHRQLSLGGIPEVATLFLVFPDEVHDIVSTIFLLLPSLLITFLLVVCFVLCLMEIVKQKKLSAIKNDFINNMTHEFKTPIATISLASQMLKDGSVNQSAMTIDHIAGIIRDESKRLTFQVEKVLQTALFTETRMKLKLKNVNLNEVVESLATKFSLRVVDRKGKLFCYPEAERDEVCADEVHITNVVSNLLDNAIKYCTAAPEISVSTHNKGDEIIVSVVDNGIGIATKDQKLIFERFYRVSTGNLHDVKGFGLGLSYVKTIVEAHGGRIEVESTEGKGSRFDVILPLVQKKQKVRRTLFF